MIDTLEFYEELKGAFDPLAAEKLAKLMGKIYREIANTVTKAEFEELRLIVFELSRSLRETNEIVRELVEAQKRTEQRVEELAEAQKRTEKEVKELALAIRETRQLVGNLSDTVGYGLEDRAMKTLPQLLKERYGIEVQGKLIRKYVKYNGKFDEIDIWGKGIRDNKEIDIIGEAKARLSKTDVDDILKMLKRLSNKGLVGDERFLFFVTYTARPEAEQYSLSMGVEVIWSFDV